MKLAVLCFIISLIYNGIAGYFAVMLDVEDDISSIAEDFSMISAVKGSMRKAQGILSVTRYYYGSCFTTLWIQVEQVV